MAFRKRFKSRFKGRKFGKKKFKRLRAYGSARGGIRL